MITTCLSGYLVFGNVKKDPPSLLSYGKAKHNGNIMVNLQATI